MKKIRIGNDFVFVWAIERNGQPEDLLSAISAKLTTRVFDEIKTLDYEIIGTGKIRIEFTTDICDIPGIYNLKFSYTLPDQGLTDIERECAIDLDAFEIVNRSALADDSTEFSITSDLAIAFKGDKGDPFLFEDFTPEQLEALKVKGDKGDAFEYSDFTPEQLALLKGEKGDTGPMADVSMTVNESGELIATINN